MTLSVHGSDANLRQSLHYMRAILLAIMVMCMLIYMLSQYVAH